MGNSIFFQICSLFYISLLIIVYFSKKRLSSLENKIYKFLLISNLLGLILDILSVFTIIYSSEIPIINTIVTKLYLVYLATWIFLMTMYIFTISRNNETGDVKNRLFILPILIYIINILLIIILPLLYFNDNNIVYSYGPASTSLYIISGIYIFIWIICMLRNFKNIKSKKYFPIFAYMIIGIIVILIQGSNPELLLMTSMETFITVLMYFTIENPDMKLINELNIARDTAEKANNAKSEFLSNMSHEIRTPLNAIVGFSQALKEENLSDSALDEVNDIIMSADNLLEIVNGILDISKIEANKLEIVNTEYRFQKILDELVILTKARIGEKPIGLKTNFDPSIPEFLYGDYIRLKQIILNLLTNAAKYTKEGTINFNVNSVIKDNICRLIISVEDTGIGIKKENIDRLFAKFERFDLEKNITTEGTGLGLAITKRLIELMNGKIIVQSVYGQGSKFTVAIDQRIIEEPTIERTQEFAPIDNVDFDISDKSVLIVDDNKINLKVASRLLSKYNVQITEVMSGKECIELIEKGNKYDLILLDDMMPHMNGKDTLKHLKKLEDFNTPVIACTANALSGMKEAYLKLGFNDYLSKPIDKKELDYKLRKFLVK